MAYLPHWLLQFGGTLGGGNGDIWSCGIRLGEQGADPTGALHPEEYLDDTAVPALSDWFSDSDTMISLNARLSFAKMNEINAAGHYKTPGDVHERFFTPVQGGASGQPLPYQVSICYTWGTKETSRGPGSRGRIYVPMPTGSIDGSTGLLPTNYTTSHCAAAANLINSLDASLGPFGAGVIRPVIATPSGGGANNQIDFVSVDNRYDIQRRRANSLAPIRSTLEINY